MSADTRRLGPTGTTVSRIGLGLAALGRPGYINLGHGDDLHHDYSVDAMAAQAAEILDAARAAGVTYVDAARSYGRAEEFLARWLAARRVPAHEITIGSKWGYTYTADWRVDAPQHEVKDHSLATLERQLPESLALLPDLRLYQVHSATLESGVLEDDVVLDALAALAGRGIAVGVTTSGPNQAEVIRRAVAVERDGRPLFATVQATWNVLEPSAGAALAEVHDAGLGVIVKEGVANGRLTERGPHAAALARAAAGPADAVALAAALAQPWADVVLSGAATVSQLRSNLEAPALAPTLDLDALAALARPPAEYWHRRASLRWN